MDPLKESDSFLTRDPCDWAYLDENKNVIRFKNFQAFMDAMKEPGAYERRHSLECRVVGQEQVGDNWVSTVFLGLDHGMGAFGGRELWFETMVFPRPGGVFPKWVGPDGKQRDDLSETYCQRYTTYYEAFVGHTLVVKRLKEGKAPGAPVEVDLDQTSLETVEITIKRAQTG